MENREKVKESIQAAHLSFSVSQFFSIYLQCLGISQD